MRKLGILTLTIGVGVIGLTALSNARGYVFPGDREGIFSAAALMDSEVAAASTQDQRRFSVTIQNLTSGQPLSPPVAATHKGDFHNVPTVTVTFTGASIPTADDALLTITAARDIGSSQQFVSVFGEQGEFLGRLYDGEQLFDESDVEVPVCASPSDNDCVGRKTDVAATDSIPREGMNLATNGPIINDFDGTIPREVLEGYAADGSIELALLPSPGVGRLKYFALSLTYTGQGGVLYDQTIDSGANIGVLLTRETVPDSGRMFFLGGMASPELEAVAEDGRATRMAALFEPLVDPEPSQASADRVTDSYVGQPLTPSGMQVGDFTDALTFEIMARPGDNISLATMLICTNDGHTGLDRADLPWQRGSDIQLLSSYDAGTEDNTELSEDIVDACSELGPRPLTRDPDGNEDAAVDTKPAQAVQLHANIQGVGDLTVEDHGWVDPVAKVTIVRVAEDAERFAAPLSGAGEVPMVETGPTGQANMRLRKNDTELRYELNVEEIEGVTQAHIHWGRPNENGPVVAFLFGPVDPTGLISGRLAQGTVTEADLVGDFAGDFAGFLEALRHGELYVNVHTVAHPAGEIRGQVGAR